MYFCIPWGILANIKISHLSAFSSWLCDSFPSCVALGLRPRATHEGNKSHNPWLQADNPYLVVVFSFLIFLFEVHSFYELKFIPGCCHKAAANKCIYSVWQCTASNFFLKTKWTTEWYTYAQSAFQTLTKDTSSRLQKSKKLTQNGYTYTYYGSFRLARD